MGKEAAYSGERRCPYSAKKKKKNLVLVIARAELPCNVGARRHQHGSVLGSSEVFLPMYVLQGLGSYKYLTTRAAAAGAMATRVSSRLKEAREPTNGNGKDTENGPQWPRRRTRPRQDYLTSCVFYGHGANHNFHALLALYP